LAVAMANGGFEGLDEWLADTLNLRGSMLVKELQEEMSRRLMEHHNALRLALLAHLEHASALSQPSFCLLPEAPGPHQTPMQECGVSKASASVGSDEIVRTASGKNVVPTCRRASSTNSVIQRARMNKEHREHHVGGQDHLGSVHELLDGEEPGLVPALLDDDISEETPESVHESVHGLFPDLRSTVDSNSFQCSIGIMIGFNSLLLCLESDREVDQAGMTMLSGNAGNVWDAYAVAEVCFTCIFCIELILRYLAHGFWLSITSRWFVFESALVLLAVVDIALTSIFSESSDALGMVMLLRVLRLMKLARVARLLRVLRELQLLFDGVLNSLRLLVWAVLMLALIFFVGAIFCTREIGAWWARQENLSQEELSRMDLLFGSVIKSMYTLFQVQTLESWSEGIVRPVMKRRPVLALFFVPYVVFITICVLNVIVAIIVESVMKETILENDQQRIQQIEKHKQSLRSDLRQLFKSSAGDDGMISRQEWDDTVKRPEAAMLLAGLGLPAEMAADLFSVLDTDESGTLEVHEFLPVLLRGLHEVRQLDLMAVQVDLWRNGEGLQNMMQSQLERTTGVLEYRLDKIQSTLETRIAGAAGGGVSSPVCPQSSSAGPVEEKDRSSAARNSGDMLALHGRMDRMESALDRLGQSLNRVPLNPGEVSV